MADYTKPVYTKVTFTADDATLTSHIWKIDNIEIPEFNNKDIFIHTFNKVGIFTVEHKGSNNQGICVPVSKTIKIIDTTETIIDSYSETNYDQTFSYTKYLSIIGQAFANKDSHKLDKAIFFLSKSSLNVTGNMTASLYECVGEPGTNGKIKDISTPLATSNPVNVDKLLVNILQLISFIFPTPHIMKALTNYVITCEFSGSDDTNFVKIGTDGSDSKHPGNTTLSTTYAYSIDTIFYIIEFQKWKCSGSPNYTCTQSTDGTYNTQTECQNICKAPPSPPTSSIPLIVGGSIGVAILMYILSKKT